MLAGLTEWLDAYGRAWEDRDAQAASELFTEDAVYQWGPFGRRLRGRVMIREAWADAVEEQDNVSFGYEVLTASAHAGIVRWWCRSDLPGRRVREKIEGIFRLAFDDTGLCTSLEEWWNSVEEPLDDVT
ncbi:MAG TPA: nuclear transport factor 2 family protein [Thermoleophilaceae bacterium]|nr:nuclear transport factor 2 family protein [Thermoleophilaceae bacterium]